MHTIQPLTWKQIEDTTAGLKEEQQFTELLPKEIKPNIYKGLILAFSSGVFFSSGSVIVKYMKNIHPAQLTFYRLIAILCFSSPELVKCGRNPLGPPNMRFTLFLRGAFGGANLFLMFVAFRFLPLGEAPVIIFSLPIVVIIMGRIFLKEPFGCTLTVIAFVTVIGMLLVSRVPLKLVSSRIQYKSENLFGLGAAFLSLLFNSICFIVLRKLKKVRHAVLMFYYGWVAGLQTFILTLLTGNFRWHNCGMEQWPLILLGLLGYGGQTLLTMALQCVMAGPVSSVRAAGDIIFAFIFQTTVFQQTPDIMSSVGAILVCASVIFVGFSKFAVNLPKDSKLRKKLKFSTM